ncbi:channel-forming protein ArfA/OmpATb [Mycolicibacterium grossiae]|uniref:Peptidoglycan-binding protein ArfA BON-like domain-containing protein n=1 Tax=Mycolicibacterium grossiae TaxID=1552759 RepID=A0A1E8Q4B9_9MYCO|nr:hypothetical protein [Mycolicibacterium grossiae]OFJ53345.1 hypothetical protein BEL07_12815 [Mycolicibacterium grossiae]QEM43619.1 hypothetical protein FZ046_01470 [Mycolicibacterium grossiae]
MAGPPQDRAVAEWRPASRFYRRRPGIGWVAALIAVPLLLAGIDRATTDVETAPPVRAPASSAAPASPSASPSPTSSAPAKPLGRFSIVRAGTGYTLAGEMPDAAEKSSLISSLGLIMPGASLTDQLTVNPAVRGPDFAALGGVFSTIPDVDDFSLRFDGTTLTLTGTTRDAKARDAAGESAAAAWPNTRLVNDIRVG